jgi:hypothetical protein
MHWRLLLHEVEFNGEHEVGPFLIFPLPFQSISQGIIDDDSDRGPTPSTSLFYKSTDVLVIQVHDYFWHNCRYLRDIHYVFLACNSHILLDLAFH